MTAISTSSQDRRRCRISTSPEFFRRPSDEQSHTAPLSLEEARARMTRAGDPPWAIESLLALAAYQRAGGPTAVVHDTVQKIVERPPRSLAEFVKDHAKDF